MDWGCLWVIIMLRKEAVSIGEIEGLKEEVNRLIEDHMLSYHQRALLHYRSPHEPHLDTLYDFSQLHYDRLRSALEKLAHLTLSLMTNFQTIWEEVEHREGKLVEVRQHLREATEVVEQLRGELEESRRRLEEAETFMERAEEERNCLEGLLERGRMGSSSGRQTRCKTQRNQPHHAGSSGLQCEQLKDYIETLRTENEQLQTSLLILSGKYETKTDECRLATMLIEHLMEELTQRDPRRSDRHCEQSRDQPKREWRDQPGGWQLSLSEMVRVLQKTEVSSGPTLNKNYALIDEDYQRYRYQESESQQQAETKREGEQTGSTFGPQMGVGTDLSYFRRRAAAVQTDWSCINRGQQDDQDYRISIQIISKTESERDQKIAKIIEDLHLQEEIAVKLANQPQPAASNQQKSRPFRELTRLNKSLQQTYQYYHNKLISSRIKKGHCPHPHPLPPRPPKTQ